MFPCTKDLIWSISCSRGKSASDAAVLWCQKTAASKAMWQRYPPRSSTICKAGIEAYAVLQGSRVCVPAHHRQVPRLRCKSVLLGAMYSLFVVRKNKGFKEQRDGGVHALGLGFL